MQGGTQVYGARDLPEDREVQTETQQYRWDSLRDDRDFLKYRNSAAGEFFCNYTV